MSKRLIQIGLISAALLTCLSANAKRTVLGQVTWKDTGEPVVGAKVSVWDSDIGADDLMAQGYTDASGRYSLKYVGRWDVKIPFSTSFRPDIYVRVAVPHKGRYIRAWTSKKKNNHKMRNDLTRNASIRPLPRVVGKLLRWPDTPVSGERVSAYDHDWNADDFMGDAITSSDGQFEIVYPRKRWDYNLRSADIYVQARPGGTRAKSSPPRKEQPDVTKIDLVFGKPKPKKKVTTCSGKQVESAKTYNLSVEHPISRCASIESYTATSLDEAKQCAENDGLQTVDQLCSYDICLTPDYIQRPGVVAASRSKAETCARWTTCVSCDAFDVTKEYDSRACPPLNRGTDWSAFDKHCSAPEPTDPR